MQALQGELAPLDRGEKDRSIYKEGDSHGIVLLKKF